MKSLCYLALALVLSGCAGVEWEKTVDADGNVHYQAMNDGARAKHEQEKQQSADMLERLESAEKRGPDEPISVALLPTYCDEGIDQKKLFKSLRNHFKGHRTIKPIDQDSVDRQIERSQMSRSMKAEYDADLVVKTTAKIEKKVGITSDGKLGSGAVLVYRAEITSRYDGLRYEVEHSCNPFRNEQGLTDFCAQVQAEISGPIRQTLPEDPHYVETGEQTPEWAKKLGKFVN